MFTVQGMIDRKLTKYEKVIQRINKQEMESSLKKTMLLQMHKTSKKNHRCGL